MRTCENCGKDHDGTYASGRFCSSICARGFSTKSKREEINEKVRKKLSQCPFTKEEMQEAADFCSTVYQMKNFLKIQSCGSNTYRQIGKWLLLYNLELAPKKTTEKIRRNTSPETKLQRGESLKTYRFRKGHINSKGRCIEAYLSNEFPIHSSKLRPKLLKEGLLEAKCYSCSNTDWLGQPISLELEHIDGNNKNNTLSNLTLLCPNCHAQTSTYRGKNIKKK